MHPRSRHLLGLLLKPLSVASPSIEGSVELLLTNRGDLV